jgi:potassium-dependent mechanosensitive channel
MIVMIWKLMRTWSVAVFFAVVLAPLLVPALAQQPTQKPQPAAPKSAPAAQPAPAPAPTQPPTPDSAPAATDAPAAPPAPGTSTPPSDERNASVGIPKAAASDIARMAAAMDAVRQSIDRLKDSDSDLARLRGEIDQIVQVLSRNAEVLRPLLAAARKQVESLGAPPAKDAPPEAPAVAAERERLSAIVANIDGGLKTIDLNEVRSRELIQQITEHRQALFARNLMRRTRSPLTPYHWERAAQDMPAAAGFARYLAADWVRAAAPVLPQLIACVAVAMLAFVGLTLLVSWLVRQSDRPPPDGRTFFQRAQRIAWVAPARMFPTVVAIGIMHLALSFLGLLEAQGTQVIIAIFDAVLLSVVVGSIIITVLSPRTPGLRLVNLANRPARHIARFLTGIVAVYAVDLALSDIGRTLVVPLSLIVMRTFAASLIYAALLTGLLLTRFATPPMRSPETGALILHATPLLAPWWLKLPLWGITGLILGSTLAGYISLGRFVAQQLVLTGTVLVAAGICYLTIRTIARTMEEPTNPLGQTLTGRLRLEQTRVSEFAWLIELLLTILLIIVVAPIVLIQWGFTAAEIRDWFATAFFGFEVGQFKISPARILIGIVVFVGLLFVTRFIQRWMRERVLEPRRVEAGIANSIETAVGYSGIALSAVIAISYAGLDITNLAIVAGALSLGIGFGLQSIVNNFVSGLILLVERPVKVGDRIVAGDQEGHVRRISVRSTEIETFDRARLIIPNSELITGRVLNKTHRSLMGRGNVRVGASYDADPEQVIDILVSCAKAHPQVLTEPPPGAVFDNFGASSLDFFMWFFVADVARAAPVQSDIRVAILREFRAAGIEIPFNQHDIHLRDLDGVRALVNRLAEERAPKPANGADPKKTEVEEVAEEAPVPTEPPPDDAPPARGG